MTRTENAARRLRAQGRAAGAIERRFAGAIRAAVFALMLALACVVVAPQASAVEVVTATGKVVPAALAGAEADGTVSVSKDADAATLQNCDFGISGFSRQNKGTNRAVEGVYYGYRYPMADPQGFSAIVADGYMIVYVSPAAEEALGIDISDARFQSDFLTLLETLDADASRGGQTFSTLGPTVYFTDEESVSVGDYTYRFGVEIESGYWYATSTLAGSEDGSGGGLYAESGSLTAANETVIVERAEGLAALGEFFANLDWSPLWVSLRTTGAAILIIFILGLLAAWGTVRVSDRWKGIFDTVFTVPMVLPPTVCGFLLLVLFGNSTPTGRWFIKHGIDIVFTWEAAVVACVVVGFPLMYRTARGAFENLDASMLDAARTLGWSEKRIFARLMLPLAWPSIAAGTVLAFARAMGEFGCTLFFAGNYAGVTQTIPLAIYFDWMGGQTDVAIFWVVVVVLLSFLVILFINVYSSRTQRYRRRLGDG